MTRRIATIIGILICGNLVATAALAAPDRIVLDGHLDDWGGVVAGFVDPAGDYGGGQIDVQSVRVTNDERFIYLRIDVADEMSFQNSGFRIHFDTDNNPATGHSINGIGSDLALLMPERRWVQQSSSQFELATVGHGDVESLVLPTHSGITFELRVRRDKFFPVGGAAMFPTSSFRMVLNMLGDTAPDSGSYLAMIDSGSLPTYPERPIERACPDDLRVVTYNMLNNGLFTRTARFTRVLQALNPDVICFEEMSNSATQLRNTMNSILPLPSGNWQTYKVGGVGIASKYPLSMQASDTNPSSFWTQAMVLVDLPDDRFAHDLYLIGIHMKCCGSLDTSEDVTRQRQADAITNWLRDAKSPGGSITLPTETAFVITGDFNMVGGHQPLDTMQTGDIIDEVFYGSDTFMDWNGNDLVDLWPLQNSGPTAYTWREDSSSFMPGRLDFNLYTGSVMRSSRSFVLNTLDMSPATLAAAGMLFDDTQEASDHLPLVADFRMTHPADVDLSGGAANTADVQFFVDVLLGTTATDCALHACDFDANGSVNGDDIEPFVSALING